MIRTQIYLPKHLYKAIDLLAKQKDKPKAEVIRGAIEKEVARQTKKANAGATLLKIASMAKENKWKGPKDLSTNIDKYLYGDA